MDFSTALKEIIQGKQLTRTGWNGKGQFVFFVPSHGDDDHLYKASFAFKAVDGQLVPWVATHTDMLAYDWEVINAD